MSELPDDVWRRIMVIGVENLVLDFEDLCRLSLTCKRLYKLSNEDSLWSLMLHQDFYYDEEDGTIASKKDFYKLSLLKLLHDGNFVTFARNNHESTQDLKRLCD
ncbi:F-box domain-containing protein [Forsythia ovata]|uniref:F-box domain-containing protein n=1 Tax=Forsythia ovata TaxID=205694 RepID=A0ABD1P623_9LAMI